MDSNYTFVHMARKLNPQLELIKRQPSAFGGSLMTTRKGRMGHRPLATKTTMHLVLRSTKATGEWSFRRSQNAKNVELIFKKFAKKYGVRVLSLGNAGNHLHSHIMLAKRQTYKPFIRAITAAIAMAVTGASRWNRLKKSAKDRFWDYRPFTRIIDSARAFLTLRDYVEINRWEGAGYSRREARLFILEKQYAPARFWSSG